MQYGVFVQTSNVFSTLSRELEHRMFRLPELKLFAARILCSTLPGWIVSKRFGNRIPYCGHVVDLSAAPVPFATYASIYWGIYESAERRFILKYLKPDLAVIELGASLGAITSVIASRLQPKIELISVEANPSLEKSVMSNLRLNASHLAYTLHSAAIGYQESHVDFQIADDNLNSSVRTVSSNGKSEKSVRVACIRLSDLVESLSVRQYQLVCDIEGMEWEVVRHDAKALESCFQIILESHDSKGNGSAKDLLPKIKKLGFELVDSFGNVAVFRRSRTD